LAIILKALNLRCKIGFQEQSASCALTKLFSRVFIKTGAAKLNKRSSEVNIVYYLAPSL
jgi:hypothetical protein